MDFQVIFIHGPAAAGKHTIGTIVAERLGLPLFHNHLTVDLVKTLFDFGSTEFIQLREQIWKSSFAVAAQAKRSFIFTFNPEVTVRPDLIVELQNLIEQNGGQIVYVELLCSDGEVEKRIDSPSRSKFGKLTDPLAFRQFNEAGSFDFPPLPASVIAVDTEQLTPEASAEAIIRVLKQR
ncbi:MAG: shikimate kinase [Chloroflexota bacterium]